MTGTTLRPRPNLVTELTAGQELPLAAVGAEQLDVILETVARVWLDLMRDQPTSLDLDEAEINMLLAARLNNLRSSDPLWTQLVSTVARGVESISFDGAHLERRPDLSIFLTGRQRTNPAVGCLSVVFAPMLFAAAFVVLTGGSSFSSFGGIVGVVAVAYWLYSRKLQSDKLRAQIVEGVEAELEKLRQTGGD